MDQVALAESAPAAPRRGLGTVRHVRHRTGRAAGLRGRRAAGCSQNPVVNWVPIAMPVAMAGGVLFALRLRKFEPQQFAAILRADT